MKSRSEGLLVWLIAAALAVAVGGSHLLDSEDEVAVEAHASSVGQFVDGSGK